MRNFLDTPGHSSHRIFRLPVNYVQPGYNAAICGTTILVLSVIIPRSGANLPVLTSIHVPVSSSLMTASTDSEWNRMHLANLNISAPQKEAVTVKLNKDHANIIFAVELHTLDCDLMSDILSPLTRATSSSATVSSQIFLLRIVLLPTYDDILPNFFFQSTKSLPRNNNFSSPLQAWQVTTSATHWPIYLTAPLSIFESM